MNYLSPEEQYYNQILIFFDGVSLLFWLIPLPFILINWKYLGEPLKLFGKYLITTLALHVLEQIHIWTVLKYDPYWEFMKKLDITDTNFLNISYRLASYIFLSFFYFKILNSRTKVSVNTLIVIQCSFVIIIYFFIDGYNKFGTVNSTLNRTFQIVLPLIYLRKISISKLNSNIWENSFVLITIGLLVTNILSLCLSFFSSGLHEANFILYVKTVIFRNVISLIGEVLFANAFINYKTTSKLNKR